MADKVIQGSTTVKLLRPAEAARALGLHPQTLNNFRHAGRGPEYVRIGGAIRYAESALEEYVAANTKVPTRRAG
jgi:predicted DNA-binding transcriptional regulator AlpA